MGKLKSTEKTKSTTPTPKKAVVGNAGTDVKKAAPADTIKPHKTSASPSNANSARDVANSAAESARNGVDKPTGMPSGKHSATPRTSPAPNSPRVQSVGAPSHTESRMTSEPIVPSGVSSAPQQSPSLIRNMMSRLPIPQTPWNIGGMKLSGVDIRNRDVPSSIANVPSKDDENGNTQDGSEEQPNALSPNEENGMPENQEVPQDEENRDSSDDNNGDNNDDDDNSLDRARAAASRSNHGLRDNAKSKNIAKDAKDKVGEAIKNLGDTMPGAGSLISQMPQQSLKGSLTNPGGLNNNSGNGTNDDPNNKDSKKKNKTPLDKLKGKAKKALIKALISHLVPILIGVMSLSAIGSCSAAMFMGNDNTEIEQTRGQNKKIVINGSNDDDICANDNNHDSDGNYSLSSDNHKENSSDPTDEWGKKIFGYYKSKGYSDAAAAAVCGNMFTESHYNTTADNGSHHGLCQWDTDANGRYAKLSSWAKENNMDPEDFKAQVEYSEKELNDDYYKNRMDGWKDSTNVSEATETYLDIFEGASGQATTDRINNAQKVMDAFSGKVSGSSQLSSSGKQKLCNNNSSTFDSGDWVYYNQNDASGTWNTKYPDNPWGSSCGIVSFAMVARNYSGDDKYNPDWAVENGFSTGLHSACVNQGACNNYINSHEDVFHLKGELIANPSNQSDFKPVIDACKSGGCAVMYINTSGVTLDWSGGAGMHWIVVRDVDEASDTATIADVAIGKESKIKWSEISNPNNIENLANGIFAYTSTTGKRSFSSKSNDSSSNNSSSNNSSSSSGQQKSRTHQLIK